MTIKYYVDPDGTYIGGFDGADPPVGSIEVPRSPDDARQIWDSVGTVWGPIPPIPPTSQPPAMRACALRNSASGGVVSSVGGSFNIAGMIQMDVGTFWVFLTDPITGAQPEVVPNNGIHVAITAWSETDFFIETRDHAGGVLIDPPSFGFTLYQF